MSSVNQKTYAVVIQSIWVLAEQGLESLTLEKLSQHTGLCINDLTSLFPEQKNMILALISDVNETAQLPSYSSDLPQDDQFFDAVMTYFDVCHPRKKAIYKLTMDVLSAPTLLFSIVPELQRVSNHLVDIYYPPSDQSLKECLQTAGQKLAIQLLLLRVFYAWLEDDTFDMSQTMMVLDQGQKQLKKVQGFLCQF